MSMIQEFKKFAVQGSVMDLAVGVIIGGAFGKIVNALVEDIVMPPIGLLLGRVDFKALYIALDGKSYESFEVARKAAAPLIAYGHFLNVVIEFLIIAWCIFLVVKQINRWQPKPE